MGSDIIVLMIPGLLFLCFFLPIAPNPSRKIFSRRLGPIISGEDLEQMTLLFLLYIVLFLVPLAGRLVGGMGHVAAIGTLFVVFLSLVLRFKKIGDE